MTVKDINKIKNILLKEKSNTFLNEEEYIFLNPNNYPNVFIAKVENFSLKMLHTENTQYLFDDINMASSDNGIIGESLGRIALKLIGISSNGEYITIYGIRDFIGGYNSSTCSLDDIIIGEAIKLQNLNDLIVNSLHVQITDFDKKTWLNSDFTRCRASNNILGIKSWDLGNGTILSFDFTNEKYIFTFTKPVLFNEGMKTLDTFINSQIVFQCGSSLNLNQDIFISTKQGSGPIKIIKLSQKRNSFYKFTSFSRSVPTNLTGKKIFSFMMKYPNINFAVTRVSKSCNQIEDSLVSSFAILEAAYKIKKYKYSEKCVQAYQKTKITKHPQGLSIAEAQVFSVIESFFKNRYFQKWFSKPENSDFFFLQNNLNLIKLIRVSYDIRNKICHHNIQGIQLDFLQMFYLSTILNWLFYIWLMCESGSEKEDIEKFLQNTTNSSLLLSAFMELPNIVKNVKYYSISPMKSNTKLIKRASRPTLKIKKI